MIKATRFSFWQYSKIQSETKLRTFHTLDSRPCQKINPHLAYSLSDEQKLYESHLQERMKRFDAKSPKVLTLKYELGMNFLRMRSFTDALAQFNDIVEVTPFTEPVENLKHISLLTSTGLAYAGVGEYQKSLEKLNKALTLSKQKSDIYTCLVTINRANLFQGLISESLVQINQILEIIPSETDHIGYLFYNLLILSNLLNENKLSLDHQKNFENFLSILTKTEEYFFTFHKRKTHKTSDQDQSFVNIADNENFLMLTASRTNLMGFKEQQETLKNAINYCFGQCNNDYLIASSLIYFILNYSDVIKLPSFKEMIMERLSRCKLNEFLYMNLAIKFEVLGDKQQALQYYDHTLGMLKSKDNEIKEVVEKSIAHCQATNLEQTFDIATHPAAKRFYPKFDLPHPNMSMLLDLDADDEEDHPRPGCVLISSKSTGLAAKI